MNLLGVIVVVHERTMDITEIKALLDCGLFGLLPSSENSLHDVMGHVVERTDRPMNTFNLGTRTTTSVNRIAESKGGSRNCSETNRPTVRSSVHPRTRCGYDERSRPSRC